MRRGLGRANHRWHVGNTGCEPGHGLMAEEETVRHAHVVKNVARAERPGSHRLLRCLPGCPACVLHPPLCPQHTVQCCARRCSVAGASPCSLVEPPVSAILTTCRDHVCVMTGQAGVPAAHPEGPVSCSGGWPGRLAPTRAAVLNSTHGARPSCQVPWARATPLSGKSHTAHSFPWHPTRPGGGAHPFPSESRKHS